MSLKITVTNKNGTAVIVTENDQDPTHKDFTAKNRSRFDRAVYTNKTLCALLALALLELENERKGTLGTYEPHLQRAMAVLTLKTQKIKEGQRVQCVSNFKLPTVGALQDAALVRLDKFIQEEHQQTILPANFTPRS